MYPACGCPEPKKPKPRDPSKRPPGQGQPRAPWFLRAQAEARSLSDLQQRLVTAVEAGLGDQILVAAEVALARISFSRFCQLAWPAVEPSTHLEWGRHHELICTTLQALFEDWWVAKTMRGYTPLVRNTIFNLPPGSLKPVSVDGLVLEESRGYVRLGDIVVGDKVLTHRGRYRKVLQVAEQGVLPLLQFTTSQGRQIKVAGDHPMLTQRGWARADCVTTKDVLAGANGEEVCGLDDQILNPDPVLAVDEVPAGECRCLQVEEDSSFVYQGVAVHNSRLIAVFFHAWVWLRAPGTKFVCVSVNESAAQRDARDTRALLLSDWYQSNFAISWTLKTDQDAISDFGNTEGGARLSRASGSVIVGLRGDFFLGDDLNDPEESDKQTERDKVNSLWDTNQYNRVNDPLRSQRICVQQRVHANDHTGHVISKQGLWSLENRNGWLLVVLPAELELSRPRFALPEGLRKYINFLPEAEMADWRTEAGETLHPARMPEEWLAGEKKRWAGTSNYAGQMQQRPTAEGGGKIKRAWFNWFRLAKDVRPGIDDEETGRHRPAECHKGDAVIIHAAHHRPGFWDFDQVVLSVDPAYKKTEKGSLWGILAFGCKGARKYLLDDRSQRGEPDEAIAILKELVRTWLPDKILIEDKAGGAGMHRTLELEMAEGDTPMVELELVNPGTLDKDARINAAIPSLANGMLYLLEGAPWLEEYVEELALYPNGMRNDRIDATTQAINHIRIDDCAYPTASAWSIALS